ncbi:phage integrase SAM-like domain-containing protein [Tellurirhabdus rosea]|uniref:phage integrase SAM-like domain-containing protein n=1 Tax=Tellurirhabdus rosea TaxID=2674997 RepID=UPI002257542D|nr:phage integrase SAM-like domain-containing protein [Tellurirhabdus rosea]
MRVLFKLRLNKKDRAAIATIYCRIKVDGIHANDFSTFHKVFPKEWDSKKQRVVGRSLQANDINMMLDQLRSDITRLFLAEPELSAQELADLYTGKKVKTYSFADLVDNFDQHCQKVYNNAGTLRTYKTRIENIRTFLKETGYEKLKANRITLGHIDEFVDSMKEAGKDHNYIIRHTQVLKNVTEAAARKEIIKVDPLASFKLKKREKKNTDHLTRKQIQTLETTTWRGPLQRVVDLFLFSCYTGLHYEDSQTLQASEVGEGIDGRMWLFKPRGKYADSQFFPEESVQVVPLHPKALAIIQKYGGVEQLPKISNVRYNDYLKQVQFIAEIKINLTVKIARKTFTDLMLNELGISEETVATMLGHKSTRHVRHYGRADERRVAKEVQW